MEIEIKNSRTRKYCKNRRKIPQIRLLAAVFWGIFLQVLCSNKGDSAALFTRRQMLICSARAGLFFD